MIKTTNAKDGPSKSGLSGVTGHIIVHTRKGAKGKSFGGNKTGGGGNKTGGGGKPKDFASFRGTTESSEKGKTDWNRLKTEMKTLREKRKKNKKQTLYETYHEAKKLWEKLRAHSCKPEDREKLCSQLLGLIQGKICSMIKSHDMARIVQWLVKLGSDSVRDAVFSEISEDLVPLCKNKYTKHAVKCLLQNGSAATRKSMVQKCSKDMYGLTCNRVSAPLVEEMFKAAGPGERAAMVKGFYGGIASDLALEPRHQVNDELTAALLSKSSKFLNSLVDKQHCLGLNLVHSVLHDYLQKCDTSSKTEMINSLKSHSRSFLSSKDGVKLFSMILWESTTKEKKQIVKEFKTEIKELALGEHSSMAVILLLDAVDDTVLVKKALVPSLLESLEEIVSSEHGRKVLIYLMAHRDSKYFHPKDIEWLSQLDSSPNIKKDSIQKVREIQESLFGPLTEKIAANPKFWFGSSSVAMVTLSILKVLGGENRTMAFSSLVSYITDAESTITEGEKVCPAIEHPGVHMVVKKILSWEKDSENLEQTLSYILVKALDDGIIERWIQSNRGSFTLVAVFETQLSSVVADLKNKLKSFKSNISKQTNKGSQILVKFLND